MDVSCPQCDTVYELDERQVRGPGVTLKCSACGHTFRLEIKAGILDESQRRWMVRQATGGDILYFVSFETLHQWIMDGVISGDDSISRTGQTWTRLADIGEFSPIFTALASIAELAAAGKPAPIKGAVGQPGDAPTGRAAPSSLGPSARGIKAAPEAAIARGRRKQTQPQFRGVGDDGNTTGGRAHAKEQGPRRRPTQPTAKGEPTGPDGGGAPPAPEVVTTQGPRGARVRLETGRFGRKQEQPTGAGAVAQQGPTFGELEFGGPADSGPGEEGPGPRRLWPLWVVAALALVVAAVIGQGAIDLSSPTAHDGAVDDEVDVVPGLAAVGEARRVVDHGVTTAVSMNRAEVMASALAVAQPGVRESLTAADGAARRAVRPTVGELIARARRSLDRGHPEQARERFQVALAESPNNLEALIGLGWSNVSAGAPTAAIPYFNRVLAIDPSQGEALIGIGRAERDRGRTEQAVEVYDEYLERFPSGPHASIARYQGDQLRRTLGD